MRPAAFLACIALAGCTWRPSAPEDCALLRLSGGFAEIDPLSTELVRLGNAVHGNWRVCSSMPAAVDAFDADARARNLRVEREPAEVGLCSRIPVTLEPTGANVRQASDVICRVAVSHGASFVSWSGTFDDKFLWIAPQRWSLSWLRKGQVIRRGSM